MANNSSTSIISVILLVSSVAMSTSGENSSFGVEMDKELMGLKREKLSHFRVYWQDIISGQNPSGVLIIRPEKSSKTGFGSTRMIDNPLTIAPSVGSKIVGRAQGFYAVASQEELALLMTMNFVFIEGKYNGSTITILGRNSVLTSVREMPIVGGSGLFRFARGYVQARTHMLDLKTGDATIEYNVYVLHY